MRISYDTKFDVLYVKFSEGRRRAFAEKLNPDIAIDFSEDGKIIGMEVLRASHYFDLDYLLKVQVEQR
jgi:uncharacterized protein YuzE